MTIPKPLDAGLLRRKVAAPTRRTVCGEPRRKVGVRLDLERYEAFKAFGARSGLTGEQVLVLALDRLLDRADAHATPHRSSQEDVAP